MRHLAEIIYYQMYRWFNLISIKRIFDADPYYTAYGTFGVFLGAFIICLIDFIGYLFTNQSIIMILYGSIYGIIIYFVLIGSGFVISYQLFRRKKRYIQIVKKKPLFKNSVPLSIFITIMYMIIFGGAFVWRILIHEIFFK